ncbi:MAG: crotonobetainyl-CoA:carnitine CoA-transferase CaiB-like acyl-CoA transferase [Halioglobus sp.]
MPGPFAGIKIIDLGTMVAGPGAATVLGDQGADVIKVEAPGVGDVMRYFSANRGGVSGLYHNVNRGKRSLSLNLKSAQGVELLCKLAAQADVLVHNYRPGVVERLGIDYDSLKVHNPALVYLSASGFGDQGPYREKPAYDGIIQAFSGVSQSQADPVTGEPAQYFQLFADKVTALTASQALSAALFARERGAGGQHIKLSMVDAVVGFMWADVAGTDTFLGEGIDGESVQQGMSVSKGARLIQFDDGYGIAAPVTDAQFAGYCRAFGFPDDDPKFMAVADRNANAGELMVLLEKIRVTAGEMSAADAIAAMEAEGVPCSTAQALGELPDHPQMLASNTFATIDNPSAGRMIEPNNPANFLGTPSPALRPAATLGQHTDEILKELGHDDTSIADLRGAGVVA